MSWCGYLCACGCTQRCDCARVQPDGEPLPREAKAVEEEVARAEKEGREPRWPADYSGTYHGLGYAPSHPATGRAVCTKRGCNFALGHKTKHEGAHA